MQRFLIILLAFLISAISPWPTQAQPPAPNPLLQPRPNSPYGMDILGPGWQWTFPRETAYPRLEGSLRIDQADEVIRKSWQAGIRHARVAAWWCFLEPEEDQYRWQDLDIMLQLSSNYGIEPVPEILYTPYWARADAPRPATGCIDNWRRNYAPDDLGDWEEFLRQMVRRYGQAGKNQVRVWEIWNEPDLPEFLSMANDPGNGTVEVYARLLRSANQVIRAVDQEAKVMLGGLSDIRGDRFLGMLLDLDGDLAVEDQFDIISFHTFSEHAHKINKLTQVLKNRGLVYELWINELNSTQWNNDYTLAATNLDPLMQLIWDSQVQRIFWFKSYTTKWGVGIFHNRDPLWEIKPFLPSPFYTTFRNQAFPYQLALAPAPQYPLSHAVMDSQPQFEWTRPPKGSFPIAGYKLQLDNSLYRGQATFHSPEVDLYIPGHHLHFMPVQAQGGPSVQGTLASPNSTTSFPTIFRLRTKLLKPLARGTYYWRVAAVDEQGNVGPYSQPQAFMVTVGHERIYMPYYSH